MFGRPPPAELQNWPVALVLEAAMILGVGVPKNAARPFWTAVTLADASRSTTAMFDEKSVRNWYGGDTAIGWYAFPGLAEVLQHEEPHAAAWIDLLRQKNTEDEALKGPGARASRRAAMAAVKAPIGAPAQWRAHVRTLGRSGGSTASAAAIEAVEESERALATLQEKVELSQAASHKLIAAFDPSEFVQRANQKLSNSDEALAEGRIDEAQALLEETLSIIGDPPEIERQRRELFVQASMQLASLYLAECAEIKVCEHGFLFLDSPGHHRYKVRVRELLGKAIATLLASIPFVDAQRLAEHTELTVTVSLNAMLYAANTQELEEAIARLRHTNAFREPALHHLGIHLAPTLAHALQLCRHVLAAGLAIDVIIYNRLIKLSDFDNGRKLVRAMRKEGVAPNHATYHRLIESAPTLEQALLLLPEMRRRKLAPTEATFSFLFQKASSFEQSALVWDRMIAAGIVPTLTSHHWRMRHAQSFNHALELFARIGDAGLTPTYASYDSVLRKATQSDERKIAFRMMMDAEPVIGKVFAMAAIRKEALEGFLKGAGLDEIPDFEEPGHIAFSTSSPQPTGSVRVIAKHDTTKDEVLHLADAAALGAFRVKASDEPDEPHQG